MYNAGCVYRQHEHRSEGSICFSCSYLSASERVGERVPARGNKDDDKTEDATVVDELICLFVCSVLEMRTFYFYCDSLLRLNSSCCLRSAINHSFFSLSKWFESMPASPYERAWMFDGRFLPDNSPFRYISMRGKHTHAEYEHLRSVFPLLSLSSILIDSAPVEIFD